MSLSVTIEKRLGNFHLSTAFTAENETLALLGASGSGKSMTLKCIAGIERPDAGRIVLDGVTLFDSAAGINLPTQKRGVGYLFQQYALFPNMTVYQNIAAGLLEKRDRAARVAQMIHAMRLDGLERRRPHQLSGGQQQRTALARLLISEPKILLLDEPFSALDSHLRFQMERELRTVIHDFGKTVLLVSHDRDEVFRLSDSIAVVSHGYITAQGSREAIFSDPKTVNGALLTGCKNLSAIEKLDEYHVHALDWGVTLTIDRPVGEADHIGVRMHSITPDSNENRVVYQVVEELENPFSYTLMLRPVGQPLGRLIGWETEKQQWNQCRGETVELSIPPSSILLLKEEAEC